MEVVECDFGGFDVKLIFFVGNFQRSEEIDERQMTLHVPVAKDFDVRRQVEPIHLKRKITNPDYMMAKLIDYTIKKLKELTLLVSDHDFQLFVMINTSCRVF